MTERPPPPLLKSSNIVHFYIYFLMYNILFIILIIYISKDSFRWNVQCAHHYYNTHSWIMTEIIFIFRSRLCLAGTHTYTLVWEKMDYTIYVTYLCKTEFSLYHVVYLPKVKYIQLAGKVDNVLPNVVTCVHLIQNTTRQNN